MFSRKTVIIAGAILLAVVCITGLSVSGKRGYSSYGSGLALFFIGPFQEVATDSIQFVKDIWNHYFFLVSVAKANDRFKKALSQAIEKNNRCNEIELSNSRLRSLLNFRKSMNEESLAAEVISKDPCPWFKSIIVDKGSADGVKKGMPVVIPEGIAGLITDVSYFYSKVLLVIDQNSAVDSLVQRTRARGIVKGNAEQCLLKYVLRKHDITEGDIVVSSGLDGVFPKGLRVGSVSDVTQSNAGIFQEVIVTPFADFEKLEEVLIVLDAPEDNVNYDQFTNQQN